ncbi:MAG: DUF1576 domain-containing protein [Oscillospiraceae bacterium]|nr:DUF1576 domain-containing protein [Oscillospiraceae bacterium]
MNEKKVFDTAKMLKLVFWLFTLAFAVAALISPDRATMFSGLKAIYTTPCKVVTDYFQIGGISATFANAFIVGLFCSLLYMLPGAPFNGVSFLAFSLTMGFCFWGMNLFNLIPCALGVCLYCLVKREPLGKNVNFMLFATGIAPIVTEMFLRYPTADAIHGYTVASVILGICVGVVIGFFTPAGCAYAPNAHKGFSLYSAALPLGMMAFFLRAVLYTMRGVAIPAGASAGESQPVVFYTFFGVLFVLCIVLGFWKNGWSFKGYGALLKSAGHKTDFSTEFGPAVALMNIGIFGLFLMLYYTLVGGSLNGVTCGLILCMVCTAVAGSHPGNVWPIMVGYVVMSFAAQALFAGEGFNKAIHAQAILIGMCYANGMSPISGKYGWLAGVIAGMMHYILVVCVPDLHGGWLLYNGGFTACLVCIFFVPMLERFAKTKEERRALKESKTA